MPNRFSRAFQRRRSSGNDVYQNTESAARHSEGTFRVLQRAGTDSPDAFRPAPTRPPLKASADSRPWSYADGLDAGYRQVSFSFCPPKSTDLLDVSMLFLGAGRSPPAPSRRRVVASCYSACHPLLLADTFPRPANHTNNSSATNTVLSQRLSNSSTIPSSVELHDAQLGSDGPPKFDMESPSPSTEQPAPQQQQPQQSRTSFSLKNAGRAFSFGSKNKQAAQAAAAAAEAQQQRDRAASAAPISPPKLDFGDSSIGTGGFLFNQSSQDIPPVPPLPGNVVSVYPNFIDSKSMY